MISFIFMKWCLWLLVFFLFLVLLLCVLFLELNRLGVFFVVKEIVNIIYLYLYYINILYKNGLWNKWGLIFILDCI